MPRTSTDQRIHSIAGPQLGLAHRAQLARVLVDSRAIATRHKAELARSVFPTVVLFGPASKALTRAQSELAGVLAAGDGAALWNDTAAAVMGMWDRPGDVIHVVSKRRVMHIGEHPTCFHRSDSFGVRRVESDAGAFIACATPTDTLRSCGRTHTPHQVAAMLRLGVHAELFRLDDVESYLALHAGMPGIAVVRAGLELRRSGSAGTRVRTEDRFHERWMALDCPAPLVNVRGCTAITDYEPDFTFHDRWVILEIDGDQHWNDPVLRTSDDQRDAVLRSMGWIVIRIHWRFVWTHLDVVVDLVRRALDTSVPSQRLAFSGRFDARSMPHAAA